MENAPTKEDVLTKEAPTMEDAPAMEDASLTSYMDRECTSPSGVQIECAFVGTMECTSLPVIMEGLLTNIHKLDYIVIYTETNTLLTSEFALLPTVKF
jgi:hypothetical protein